jgi:hypothetical protein
MEDLFAFTSKLKVDVQNVVGLVYAFTRNVKIIALNVLKVNAFVSIKNEKVDVRNARVRRYAHMAIVNIVVYNVIQIIFVSTKNLKINALNVTGLMFANIKNDEVHALYALQKVDVKIVNTYPLLAPVGNPIVSVATVY